MQVHRFHSRIAVSLGTGQTVYLTAKDAGRLSAAINKAKREILQGVKFQDSTVGTFNEEAEDY
jgi:hypothetical protein